MKIAMIAPYPIFPPDEGGRMRAYQLLKHLSADHEMILLAPKGAAACDLPVTWFETPPGRRRQILSPRWLRTASRAIREQRPDLLLVEFPWNALQAAMLGRRYGVPVVLDAHNVEADRFRSADSRWWPAMSLYERLVTRVVSRILVVSEEDRARFVCRGVRATKIDVVPNGVDPVTVHPDPAAGAAVRRALDIGDETRLLLFFGQLDYTPNRDALVVIEREILPRLDRLALDYRVVICGKGAAPAITHPRVQFAGAVPSMVPYVNAADVVLAPILAGGGTRLKILESIACGTPVVSTTAGAEGIDRGVCGDRLQIADGWDAFAASLAVKPLLGGGNVPAGFLDMYSWAAIVRRISWPVPAER